MDARWILILFLPQAFHLSVLEPFPPLSPPFGCPSLPLLFVPVLAPDSLCSRGCVLPPVSAVTATGVIWSRYSFVITPVNYNLFSVNAAMAVTGGYQLYRRIMYVLYIHSIRRCLLELPYRRLVLRRLLLEDSW